MSPTREHHANLAGAWVQQVGAASRLAPPGRTQLLAFVCCHIREICQHGLDCAFARQTPLAGFQLAALHLCATPRSVNLPLI